LPCIHLGFYGVHRNEFNVLRACSLSYDRGQKARSEALLIHSKNSQQSLPQMVGKFHRQFAGLSVNYRYLPPAKSKRLFIQ
jgi:hypothetical protein